MCGPSLAPNLSLDSVEQPTLRERRSLVSLGAPRTSHRRQHHQGVRRASEGPGSKADKRCTRPLGAHTGQRQQHRRAGEDQRAVRPGSGGPAGNRARARTAPAQAGTPSTRRQTKRGALRPTRGPVTLATAPARIARKLYLGCTGGNAPGHGWPTTDRPARRGKTSEAPTYEYRGLLCGSTRLPGCKAEPYPLGLSGYPGR